MSYTFEQYHEDVGSLASYPCVGNNMPYPALGLAGESGELLEKAVALLDHASRIQGFVGRAVEKVKKLWRNCGLMGVQNVKLDTKAADLRTGLIKEAGDVLWYLDAIATEAGTTLEEVALLNAEKLNDRAARGVIKAEGDNR